MPPSSLGDRLGVDDDGYGLAEQRVLLDGLLRGVSPRDREILHMRYFEDMTQAEIGEVFGVSQMQVSRLVRSSIERMQVVAGRPCRARHDDRATAPRDRDSGARAARISAEIAAMARSSDAAGGPPRGTGTPPATARRSAGRRAAIDAALRVAAPRADERLVDLGDRQRARAPATRRAARAARARRSASTARRACSPASASCRRAGRC